MNDSFNSNDTGGQNPIFDIMREEDLKKNLMPVFPYKPNDDKYSIKQNYRNEIDKMFVSLKEFNNNIMQMMISTNRMLQIIDENTIIINIRFVYKDQECWVYCKLKDKISDVIKKIKINEDGFTIDNKNFFFNGKILELNQSVGENGLSNNSYVLIHEIKDLL